MSAERSVDERRDYLQGSRVLLSFIVGYLTPFWIMVLSIGLPQDYYGEEDKTTRYIMFGVIFLLGLQNIENFFFLLRDGIKMSNTKEQNLGKVRLKNINFWASYVAAPIIAIICLVVALVIGLKPEMRLLAVYILLCVFGQGVEGFRLMRSMLVGLSYAMIDKCDQLEVVGKRMDKLGFDRSYMRLPEDKIDALRAPLDGETDDEKELASYYLDILQ